MRLPWLSKRGYVVRLPSGEYRGVYGDYSTARLIRAMADLNELTMFGDGPPKIVPCRVRPWVRFGVRVKPMEEETS